MNGPFLSGTVGWERTLRIEVYASFMTIYIYIILKSEATNSEELISQDTVRTFLSEISYFVYKFFQFPNVASSIIPMLVEFVSDLNELAALDVLEFLREAVQKLNDLRPLVVDVGPIVYWFFSLDYFFR